MTLPGPCAAGIYTSQNLIPLIATIFEIAGIPLSSMEGYVSTHGRAFYGYPAVAEDKITLRRVDGGKMVPNGFGYEAGALGRQFVVPFMAGQKLGWEVVE